jgi:Mg/Co/Ni transporter MgtE
MEMQKHEFKEIGQEITRSDFENNFLKQSIEGLKVVDSKGFIRRDVPYDEILNELNESEIKEIYYIENMITVKVLYTNGDYNVLYRE